MVNYKETTDRYRSGKKRFVPNSDYVKYHDGYWYPVRMTTYLYWFKFLQECEKSEEFEVDWKKYKAWGSRDEIMEKEFPLNFIWEFKKQFFSEKCIELFGMKEKDGIPKFGMIDNKTPKRDTLRRQLLTWMYKDDTPYEYPLEDNKKSWDIALKVLWHEKNRLIPSPYFDLWCQLPNNEWDNDTFLEIGSSSNDIKVTAQNYVSRDLKQAREILKNVSNGMFPR